MAAHDSAPEHQRLRSRRRLWCYCVLALLTHVVLSSVRDRMQLDPEAVIVYMDNNEALGPFDCGTVFGVQAPKMWKTAFSEAVDYFERVINLNPGDAEVHGGWALGMTGQGKVDEAVVRLQVALKDAPEDLRAGQYPLREQYLELADKHHRGVGRLEPNVVQSRMDLARLCMPRTPVTAGIEQWQEDLRLDSSHVKARAYWEADQQLMSK